MDNSLALIIDASAKPKRKRPAPRKPIIVQMAPAVEKPSTLCHITRSFTYKLNAGNYESRDFFMSQSVECRLEDAERMSDIVYEFCKKEVMKSVAKFKADAKAAFGPSRQLDSAALNPEVMPDDRGGYRR